MSSNWSEASWERFQFGSKNSSFMRDLEVVAGGDS